MGVCIFDATSLGITFKVHDESHLAPPLGDAVE